MKLPIFSVAGEALNFGARRMETIMRVAWLPVALLLILNMVAVYAFLTVIAERVITFAQVPNFAQAQGLLTRYAEQGWTNHPNEMLAISAGYIVLQIILLSSFIAPLIRLAGRGERPAPGVVRLPFGPDQIRLVISGFFSAVTTGVLAYGPLLATSFYIEKYLDDALSKTLASFPNPDSLHELELVTTRDVLTASGDIWIYDYGIPWMAAIPFAVILWIIVTMHFHPRNRLKAGAPNGFARAFWSGLAVVAMVFGAFFLLRWRLIQSGEGDATPFAPAAALLLILSYLALRLFAYPGVAVSRKSLAAGPVWRITRGWNLSRLLIVLLLVYGVLAAALYVINTYALGWLGSTIGTLYQAVASTMPLISGAETPDWILSVFVWIWNGTKIIINIFWTFFSYGVLAGLWGRLYRESEREAVAGDEPISTKEIWRR